MLSFTKQNRNGVLQKQWPNTNTGSVLRGAANLGTQATKYQPTVQLNTGRNGAPAILTVTCITKDTAKLFISEVFLALLVVHHVKHVRDWENVHAQTSKRSRHTPSLPSSDTDLCRLLL